LKDTAQTR